MPRLIQDITNPALRLEVHTWQEELDYIESCHQRQGSDYFWVRDYGPDDKPLPHERIEYLVWGSGSPEGCYWVFGTHGQAKDWMAKLRQGGRSSWTLERHISRAGLQAFLPPPLAVEGEIADKAANVWTDHVLQVDSVCSTFFAEMLRAHQYLNWLQERMQERLESWKNGTCLEGQVVMLDDPDPPKLPLEPATVARVLRQRINRVPGPGKMTCHAAWHPVTAAQLLLGPDKKGE